MREDGALEARSLAVAIEGTTDSLLGQFETLPSSRVPSALSDIQAPVAYVWSARGRVPRETIDRLGATIVGLHLVESDSWMAHVDDPDTVIEGVESVSP